MDKRQLDLTSELNALIWLLNNSELLEPLDTISNKYDKISVVIATARLLQWLQKQSLYASDRCVDVEESTREELLAQNNGLHKNTCLILSELPQISTLVLAVNDELCFYDDIDPNTRAFVLDYVQHNYQSVIDL